MPGPEQHRQELPGIDQPPAINPTVVRRKRPSPTVDALWENLQRGQFAALSRSITLLESQLEPDQRIAQELLTRAMEIQNPSRRLGITGIPGVGKSTLIESFGLHLLTDPTIKLAVLAIDPSSELTGGSILGDKSRMSGLSQHPRCFIRPSPARGALGGVGMVTREAILLCEAAGLNWIVVETVGVGQSETLVRGMVDVFLLLMLAGAGDELQGIKRGLMELGDVIAVTKSDGENRIRAEVAAQQISTALHYFAHQPPKILTVSAFEHETIVQLTDTVQACFNEGEQSGNIARQRHAQILSWTSQLLSQRVEKELRQAPELQAARAYALACVERGEWSPRQASDFWWQTILHWRCP